jgi:hypothetical protein
MGTGILKLRFTKEKQKAIFAPWILAARTEYAAFLTRCATGGCQPDVEQAGHREAVTPLALAAVAPSVRAEDIIGRWGLATYHREEDRSRTETMARGQCTHPYFINRSTSGRVTMLGHDSPQAQDMRLKGSAEGKTYVGPGSDPAGVDDREIVSFDGQFVILRWVDPEVAGRYGNMVLVRCAP